MRRTRPLAVGAALIPVLGSAPRERTRRQRAGAALHWRKPAAARDYPKLNLTIRPAYRFHFDLGMLQREVQHFARAGWQAPTHSVSVRGPRGASGLSTAELQWRTAALPAAVPASGALRQTPAEFVVQTRRAFAAPALDIQPAAAARNRRVTVILPAWRETSVVRPEVRIVAATSHPTVRQWARSNEPRRSTTAKPVAVAATAMRAQTSPLPVSAPRTNARHTTGTPGRRLLRADIALTATEQRQAATPASLTRSIAMPSPRPAPSVQPHTRRAALDLAWQPRADTPASAKDLASLARSLNAPEFTRAVAVTRNASPASNPAAPTALPNTGRIVDEVIDRIERRMRSDRLRRGL